MSELTYHSVIELTLRHLMVDLSVKRLQIDGYICPPLLLHLINYPKRTVQKQCKPSAENLFFAEVQPVFANFCLQSYGKSRKITTFAP